MNPHRHKHKNKLSERECVYLCSLKRGFLRVRAPSLAGFAVVMIDIWVEALRRQDDCCLYPLAGKYEWKQGENPPPLMLWDGRQKTKIKKTGLMQNEEHIKHINQIKWNNSQMAERMICWPHSCSRGHHVMLPTKSNK